MQSSRNGAISFSVYFSVLVFSVTSSNASVWYADAESTSAAPTGTNWCDAYRNLQDALAAASFGDEVRVADGVYRPDDGAGQTVGDRLATFVLKSGTVGTGSPTKGFECFRQTFPQELFQKRLIGEFTIGLSVE